MKKIIILLVLTFVFGYKSKCQVDTTELKTDSLETIIEQWKYTFKALDKTQLSTGMLKEYSIFPTILSEYNGKHDSTMDADLIHSIHSQCKGMLLDSTKSILPFDSIENRSAYYRAQNINPLVILNYQYNTFHDSAFAWNLIDSTNGQYVDVAGRTRSPYITENVFGVSPFCFSMGRDTSVSFYVGSNMFLGNDSNTLNNLSIDFGNGWTALNTGITSYNFPGFGVYDVSIKCTISSTITYTCKFKISVTKSIKDLGANFHYNSIEADSIFNGKRAKGVYVFRYGKGNASGGFKKPFIITDGIDFGYNMDKVYGWEHCRDGKCNTLGFIDIYTGIDYNYEKYTSDQKLPEFAKGSKLFDKLYDEGYDVIFLDYEAGAGYMQANAMLVVKLINYVNQNKNGEEELVVCGPSMGGQIVRYALSYMETHKMKHCTRSAVYFDSPHKGANIPIGMQLWLNYFSNHNTDDLFKDAVIAVNQKLDRVATRQLLNNHFSINDYGPAQERYIFMNDLVNNLGSFPQSIRQIAITNGSCHSKKQLIKTGDRIIDMKIPIGSYRHTIRGVAYATCGNYYMENRIFYGDALGMNNLEKINWQDNSPNFDNSPGSFNDALKSLKLLKDVGKGRWKYGVIDVQYDVATFIPTNSGLCLQSDDLLYDVSKNISNADAPNSTKYAFDAFYMNNNNQTHMEMTDDNIDWFITELKRTENLLFNLPSSYTYWGTDNQYHTSQQSSFNFGNHFRQILNSVEINSGGKLLVNSFSNTNYGTTGDYYNSCDNKFIGQCFELKTANCASEVSINNGGQFTIGDNNIPNNNKGIVTIREGSNLYLNSGSHLYIYSGSKLIIEKDATLFVENNNDIYIEDGASIEIKGRLYLTNNAYFKPYGPGKVVFNNANNTFGIAAGNSAIIEFKSTNNETKLEVYGTITTPSQLSLFKVEGATVQANIGSSFNLYSPVYFDYATFKPSISNTTNSWGGLKFNNQYDNNVYIAHSKFYYATTALDFSADYSLSSPSFYLDEFYNNTLAMSLNDVGFTLNNCKFLNNTTALDANWIVGSSVINGCNFKDNTLGIDYQGNTNALLLLKSNTIISSGVRIISPSTNQFLVTMSCNKFTTTPILIIYASVNLSSITLHNTSDYGGYNIFKESPFTFNYIKYLNLANGYNDFMMNSNKYIYGTINNSNNLGSSQVNSNYFDRINGGSYPLPNGITPNVYNGKIDLIYNNTANFTSMVFKLYGTLLSQQNGGCQGGGGGGFAPVYSKNGTEQYTNAVLYPNPTNDKINIGLPATEANTSIQIVDMQGKVLINGNIASGTNMCTIDVLQLPAGIYMVLLQDGITTERLRFVKN